MQALPKEATAVEPEYRAKDVEDYSLTLLKYREYYTEKPLGRCLDEEDKEQPKASPKTPETQPLASTQQSQDNNKTNGEEPGPDGLYHRDPEEVKAF